MAGAAAEEIQSRLNELDRQRDGGELTEIAYTVRRNLLMNQSLASERRRAIAMRFAPRLAVQVPVLNPPRRLRSRTVGLVGVIAILATASIALIIHSQSTPSPTTTRGVPPAAGTTSTAPLIPRNGVAERTRPPSAAPAAVSVTGAEVGVTRIAPLGQSITLLSVVDHFSPPSLINNPLPAGGFYVAVEFKVCSLQSSATVSPFDFDLVEPDGSLVSIATGPTVGRQPALQLTVLPAGGCTSGWLSYGVTTLPRTLTDQAAGLSWALGSN